MRTNRKMLNLNLPPIVEALFALKALHLYKSRSLSFLGQSLPFGFLFLDSLRLVLKLSLPERKPKILGGIIIKGNTVTNFIGPGDGSRGPCRDPHHAPRRVPHHATSKRREIRISRNLHYLLWYILYFLPCASCHLDQ